MDADGFAVASVTHITNQRLTCVSVKISDEKVEIRDTKDPNKTTLSFNHPEWAAFISGVKDGEFDI